MSMPNYGYSPPPNRGGNSISPWVWAVMGLAGVTALGAVVTVLIVSLSPADNENVVAQNNDPPPVTNTQPDPVPENPVPENAGEQANSQPSQTQPEVRQPEVREPVNTPPDRNSRPPVNTGRSDDDAAVPIVSDGGDAGGGRNAGTSEAGSGSSANVPIGRAIGQRAPEITGRDVDGVQFKLSDYRGKVVVLDFWGDW